jgi:hypothetical protein
MICLAADKKDYNLTCSAEHGAYLKRLNKIYSSMRNKDPENNFYI